MTSLNSGFKKALCVWLAGAAALLVVYGVVLWPQQKRASALQRQVQESNQRLDKLQQAQSPAYQQRVRTELQQLQQQYEALCFDTEKLARLDFRIHDLAMQNHVNKFSSKNDQTKVDKHFSELKLTDQRKLVIVLDADFPSFLRLVNALERNQPALFVQQVVLSKSFFEEKELPTGRIEFSALYAKTPQEDTVAQTQ